MSKEPKNSIWMDLSLFIFLMIANNVYALAASITVWSMAILVFRMDTSFMDIWQVCAFIALIVSVLRLGQEKMGN